MESITCVKAHQRLEYRASGKVIRWTEVHTATIVTTEISVSCSLTGVVDWPFFDSTGVLSSEGGAVERAEQLR